MKTAAIILISLGIFVLIKDSKSADAEEVFIRLSKGFEKKGIPYIPITVLTGYLQLRGWIDARENLKADAAAALIAGDDDVISMLEWTAITKAADIISKKNHSELLKKLKDSTKIHYFDLGEFLVENGWDASANRMVAYAAAKYIAGNGNDITKNKWTAMIETARIVRGE